MFFTLEDIIVNSTMQLRKRSSTPGQGSVSDPQLITAIGNRQSCPASDLPQWITDAANGSLDTEYTTKVSSRCSQTSKSKHTTKQMFSTLLIITDAELTGTELQTRSFGVRLNLEEI